MIRVDRHPKGPRVYVAGRRVHHGTAALATLAVSRNRKVRLVAYAALLHDIRDFPFRDTDNH